jgi:hypothetical protein
MTDLKGKHKMLLHLSILYEYLQFFQHRICFSIQPPDYSDPWPTLARSTFLFNNVVLQWRHTLTPHGKKMHVKEIYVISIHLFDSGILLIIYLNKKKKEGGEFKQQQILKMHYGYFVDRYSKGLILNTFQTHISLYWYKCGHRNVLSKRQVWMSIFHIINFIKKNSWTQGSWIFFNRTAHFCVHTCTNTKIYGFERYLKWDPYYICQQNIHSAS